MSLVSSGITGLDIVANRLFGPRPAAATYVCIWEIHVGDVKTSVNAHEARLLSSIGSAFGLNFSDPLNAPAKEYAIPADPDGECSPRPSNTASLTYYLSSDLSEGSSRHSQCRVACWRGRRRTIVTEWTSIRYQRSCRQIISTSHQSTLAGRQCEASAVV